MDTSKQYIEMCDCPEIQEGRVIQAGDVFAEEGGWGGDPELVTGIAFDCDDTFYSQPDGDALWLPRQDQLQEMVEKRYTLDVGGDYNHWLGDLLTWFEPFWRHYGMNNETTMEQLWLAFVMKEKHSKVWNGEEWDAIHTARRTPRTTPPD